jgi:tRNA pseudouridine38-40 synthase
MQDTHETPPRNRYRLNLEFVGTGFSGWQKQTKERTIQGTLLEAAAQIFGDQAIDIQGHGRTDAGVHALNYTAHLETGGNRLDPANLCERFNNLLPSSIVMLEVAPCHPRFHARHNCIGRSYLYQISRRKSAFQRNLAWWTKGTVDCDAMSKAAKLFSGMHDFASFAEKPELKKSTKVLVNGVFVYNDVDDEMVRIRVVGSHFLWKMVRRMASALVEVGQGNMTEADVAALLTGENELRYRVTAPAAGLHFEEAFYDQAEFDRFLASVSGNARD